MDELVADTDFLALRFQGIESCKHLGENRCKSCLCAVILDHVLHLIQIVQLLLIVTLAGAVLPVFGIVIEISLLCDRSGGNTGSGTSVAAVHTDRIRRLQCRCLSGIPLRLHIGNVVGSRIYRSLK